MEIRENLELVEVEYENNGQKAVMTFLDKVNSEVRVVNFNKQSYKDGKFVDDPEKAEKVEEWCTEFFGTSFDNLAECLGSVQTLYVYEKFNSLWEVDQVEKFTKDMNGQIYQTEVKEVILDDYFIKIRYEIDGKIYESKQTFGKYLESNGSWFLDPQKRDREFAKFEEKYLVPVEERDSLVGHTIMVEVKCAFGTHYYGDIKKFPRK